jgi:hypothetical protein
MNKAITSFTLLLLSLAPHGAEARIYRCIDAAGTPVFADRPCHLLEAFSLPRIDTPDPQLAEVEPGEDRALRATRCPAADGAALISAVEAVFAERDVNAFAALYHWVDATRGYAYLVMERMQRLLKEPLLEVAFEPEMPEDTWSTDETELPDLRIDTGMDSFDDRRSTWFRLRRHAGCLWLVL